MVTCAAMEVVVAMASAVARIGNGMQVVFGDSGGKSV